MEENVTLLQGGEREDGGGGLALVEGEEGRSQKKWCGGGVGSQGPPSFSRAFREILQHVYWKNKNARTACVTGTSASLNSLGLRRMVTQALGGQWGKKGGMARSGHQITGPSSKTGGGASKNSRMGPKRYFVRFRKMSGRWHLEYQELWRRV